LFVDSARNRTPENGRDSCFYLWFEEESLPRLKQITAESKRLGKPIYSYFVVERPKNLKVLNMIGWPASTDMENAENFTADLELVVDGIIAVSLCDVAGDMGLLKRLN